MITFLRVRPADRVTEVWAETRRREGTTAIEVGGITAEDVAAARAGGLLPVAAGVGPVDAAAWVVEPAEALSLTDRGIEGWRITVIDTGHEESVLDAVARSRAAYVRAGRSRVASMAELMSLPGLAACVSVFVDSVEDAVEAVGAGAGDLLLRDWDTERIGQLRDALGGVLVERTAYPLGVEIDAARSHLLPELFTA